MNNALRIVTARAALARAAWVRGETPCYSDEAVIDLLADLKHLCAAANINYAVCERLAEVHFDAEHNEAT